MCKWWWRKARRARGSMIQGAKSAGALPTGCPGRAAGGPRGRKADYAQKPGAATSRY